MSGQNGASDSACYLLPYPPHANNLYFTFRNRRVKSSRYRKWIEDAAFSVRPWRAFYGPVALLIQLGLPDRRKRDIDGAAKACIDLLVREGIITDDSWQYVKRITIEIPEAGDPFIGAKVTVIPLT